MYVVKLITNETRQVQNHFYFFKNKLILINFQLEMLRIEIPFYCVVLIALVGKTVLLPVAPQKNTPCNTTYDCFDQQMVCSKMKTCVCANFHDWERITKKCIPNITKIYRWLKETSSSESEIVFQQEDFIVKQVEPYTILSPKWAEYHGVEEAGLGHVSRVIWPLLLGVGIIIIIYGAILLECM